MINYTSKRVTDLEVGDVICDPPWLFFMGVRGVRGPMGSPPWVIVEFEPTGSKSYSAHERVEVVVQGA